MHLYLFPRQPMKSELLCNDVHSKLNRTRVARILYPVTENEVIAAISQAAVDGLAISICGARHAMGGQQFGEGTLISSIGAFFRVTGL
jgi:FAD/FMN-containing dehydrogenase